MCYIFKKCKIQVFGGLVESSESHLEAAQRELREELPCSTIQAPISEPITLHPFSLKQTKAIRDRSHIMYNYIALASQNPWLASLDVTQINQILNNKSKDFYEKYFNSSSISRANGNKHDFWKLTTSERELVSPEVLRNTHIHTHSLSLSPFFLFSLSLSLSHTHTCIHTHTLSLFLSLRPTPLITCELIYLD